MELSELKGRLLPFCKAHYRGESLRIFDVVAMPGHAGFAYGFRVETGRGVDSWFIRLPPPNVKWRGTADVLRQVAALNALDSTDVPHCSVQWSGDDLEWFGCPYFVVPWMEGDVLRLNPGEMGAGFSEEQLFTVGRQAMQALAGIHRIDPRDVSYLGEPVPLADDVLRWNRFLERAADPEALEDAPTVRRKLLDLAPVNPAIGLFHGDFQGSNLFCSGEGELLAIIDWELCGIGAALNDLGWVVTFNDAAAWAPGGEVSPPFLDPETLIRLYREAGGAMPENLRDLDWFRALAAYKFAIITGFNLSLHRRGKRPDPMWEGIKDSMPTLIARANELLS